MTIPTDISGDMANLKQGLQHQLNAKIHERVDGAEAKINAKMGIEYGDVPETKAEHGLSDMTADEWADSATSAIANDVSHFAIASGL